MTKLMKAIAPTSLLGFAASAKAIPVQVTFTADNVNDSGGLCDDSTGWTSLGSTPNDDNWQIADSITLDLGPDTC